MHRVVITGIGQVSSLGNDAKTFWENIKAGKSGIGPITNFDASGINATLASEARDFDPSETMDRKEYTRMDRFSQFGVAASVEAAADSGYDIEANADNVGVFVSTGIGGIEEIEKNVIKVYEKGPKRVSPLFIPMIIGNMGGANIAMKVGAQGANLDIVTACASGTNSIGEAFLKIKYGFLDAALAGGTEAPIQQMGMANFDTIRALSPNSDPETASRPFDKDRDGFVMGEGAGVLFMETLESAEARGADIIAEVVGYGTNNDAYHMTAPRPDGSGAAKAMDLALKVAGLEPTAIDYINAHGTSTPANDIAETKSIKTTFGDHAYDLAVSSTKGHTGHLLGGAGGVEGIVIAKALQEGYIPATIGLENPEEGCDLDYVPGQGREQEIQYAMSNSLGFGGHNASIIFKRWDGE